MRKRRDREALDLRKIKISNGYIQNSPGSTLFEQGSTKIISTATFTNKVPFFLKEKQGWLSAEYSMLPGSTGNERINRERQKINKRNIEIQRFIGRALRTSLNLKKIEERTILIDTDVIQADGGTRCASINSAMLSLYQLLKHLVYENLIADFPDVLFIAGVSIGVKDNAILVDLNYEEDANADSDINIVSSEKGEIIEIEGFVEQKPLSPDMLKKIIDIGIEKNFEIIKILKNSLGK